MYHWVGNQYMTAPAFGSLQDTYKKVAFSFAIPTIIFLGVLYASVSARFVFLRIFHNSRHKSENTVIGWATWAAILRMCFLHLRWSTTCLLISFLVATWILAFIIANSIPFFSSREYKPLFIK